MNSLYEQRVILVSERKQIFKRIST
jgi:hypothetical protein